MKTSATGEGGFRLLLDLNADAFLYAVTVAAALGLGALTTTLVAPVF
jgi:hypothetical protein